MTPTSIFPMQALPIILPLLPILLHYFLTILLPISIAYFRKKPYFLFLKKLWWKICLVNKGYRKMKGKEKKITLKNWFVPVTKLAKDSIQKPNFPCPQAGKMESNIKWPHSQVQLCEMDRCCVVFLLSSSGKTHFLFLSPIKEASQANLYLETWKEIKTLQGQLSGKCTPADAALEL